MLYFVKTIHEVAETVVGRTHTIVRLQTRTRQKDGTENFGGFVYVLGGFLQRGFVLWVFMRSINFSVFFCVSFPATTPRATTPHLYPGAIMPLPPLHGYHARVHIIYILQYIYIYPGYYAIV